jgi:multicomponent Na+:H+ antiporter subunit B
MSPRARLILFMLACLCILPGAAVVIARMPAFGAHPLPYGDAINQAATAERHVTNMVSAVNFDYRGFDTLGEEFMLLCAVTGAVLLLRGSRGEALSSQPASLLGRVNTPRSDAVVLIGRLIGPIIMVFGIYVVLHATTTPGGGFQGGVIISSGLLLLFLSEEYQAWRKIVRSAALGACEGGGALVFVLAGVGPMLWHANFLQNIMPLGQFRDMLSGGLMQIVNAGVAFAVLGGFSLVFLEFLEETRAPQEPQQ